MNDRPSSSSGDAAPVAVEGWLLLHQQQQQQQPPQQQQHQETNGGPAGPDTIQHHDQSPFVTHSRNHQHHHLYHHHHHHHQTAGHFMKGALWLAFSFISNWVEEKKNKAKNQERGEGNHSIRRLPRCRVEAKQNKKIGKEMNQWKRNARARLE